MFSAKITVTLRESILDPEGKVIEQSLHHLGYNDAVDVRTGKYIELKVNVNEKDEAEKIVDTICEKLLANPVMEEYSFELRKIEGDSKE